MSAFRIRSDGSSGFTIQNEDETRWFSTAAKALSYLVGAGADAATAAQQLEAVARESREEREATMTKT